MPDTQKMLFDKLTFLKFSTEQLEKTQKDLVINLQDHQDNVDVFVNMLNSIQHSLVALRTKAAVVSLSAYKDLMKKEEIIVGSLEEAKIQVKMVQKLLTFNEETVINNTNEINRLEKELSQFGRLYDFP